MVSKSASNNPPPPSRPTEKQRFKGVRMRSWGKWVSEIRLPNTRARLWLGSFTTAEQAARAFDVAVVCLRGRSATLNFPNSPPTYAPLGLPHHRIQELAAAAAAAAPPASSSPAPSSCDESESATISSSSCSDESEAATTSDMNSSCSTMNDISSSSSSCCSSFDDSATFASLLERDQETEQSSPLDAALLQEHALNLGSEWDELLWGFPMTAHSAEWGEPLLVLPSLLIEDDLPTIFEPTLWNI